MQFGGLHQQRLAIAAAAVLGMLAVFLPWAHAPFVGAILGTAGRGWLTLLLFLPALILAFCGERLDPLTGGARLGAVIPAALAALSGLWRLVYFTWHNEDSLVQLGGGIFLLILAGAALTVLAWTLAAPLPGRSAPMTPAWMLSCRAWAARRTAAEKAIWGLLVVVCLIAAWRFGS